MDILTRILDQVQSAIGAEVFDDSARESVERQVRISHGGQKIYVATVAAMKTADLHAMIRRLIRKGGMTQREIAERVGCSQPVVFSVAKSMTKSVVPNA